MIGDLLLIALLLFGLWSTSAGLWLMHSSAERTPAWVGIWLRLFGVPLARLVEWLHSKSGGSS